MGGQSDDLIVYTHQTNIATGLASLHDTSEAGVAADLANAPKPGSLTLVGSGLIGLAGLLRRKLLQATVVDCDVQHSAHSWLQTFVTWLRPPSL